MGTAEIFIFDPNDVLGQKLMKFGSKTACSLVLPNYVVIFEFFVLKCYLPNDTKFLAEA